MSAPLSRPLTSPALVGNTEPAFAHFWHPVATAAQVAQLGARPMPVEVAGRHYVLVRLGDAISAFVDSCPHRSYPLSDGDIVEGTLRCPYHGYRFDAGGSCVAIPAIDPGTPIGRKAALQPAAGVVEHLGLVWLAPEEPWAPLPALPEFDDDAFGQVLVGPQTWRAGAAQMTENFLDVSHFPFVHSGTFGVEADAVVPPFSVERDGLAFSYRYGHQFRNGEEVAKLHGATSPEQRRLIRSDFFAPFGVIFRIDYLETGVVTVVFSAVAPIDGDTSRLFSILLGTDMVTGDLGEALEFEEKILWEDQVALEGYRQREMVLDLDRQYHTAADRMTVEYRRVMTEILTRAL
jgi:phenylpropionate dioxygenase-like ring-hydroxylating dioxygenase large terminal subunit